MNQKNQNELEAAAHVSAVLGGVMLVLAVLIPAESGTKFQEAAAGLAALGWGARQIVLIKKRKAGEELTRQEQVQDERLEKQLEKMDKSGSMKNVGLLLVWILAALFLIFAGCVIYLRVVHPVR
ncbi:MAG TPA: hypothetical protein VK742_18820 [Candidatus Sulfotelmatobacter sp.]|nr:hypothetical protein [Candidatus Sulfotelmatobacter sp.]